MSTPAEGPMPVYEKFLQFRAIVIQAIALAWADDAFHKQFLESPTAAMKERFDYDFPFDVDVESNPDNAAWGGTAQGDWVVSKENTLTMILPPKPDNPEDLAYALATYNTHHLTFLSSSTSGSV